MKTLALLVLFLSPLALCLRADSISNLKRDAKRCTEAWNRGDYPVFVSLLSDRVVADAAARDAALAEIKNIFGYLDSVGLKSLQVSLGEPESLKKFQKLSASIVPVRAVMEGPGGKITAPSHVLAVSADEGASWKFVILYHVSQWQLDARFPEFEKKLPIPAFIQPVIEQKKPNQTSEPTAPSGRGSP